MTGAGTRNPGGKWPEGTTDDGRKSTTASAREYGIEGAGGARQEEGSPEETAQPYVSPGPELPGARSGP